MNVKKRLEHISNLLIKERQTGNTQSVAKAAQETNGILLCANFEQAKMLKNKYNIATEVYEKNLDGYSGPFYIDHYALSQLLQQAVRKISELEELNKKLTNF
jgi:hypothetical protein